MNYHPDSDSNFGTRTPPTPQADTYQVIDIPANNNQSPTETKKMNHSGEEKTTVTEPKPTNLQFNNRFTHTTGLLPGQPWLVNSHKTENMTDANMDRVVKHTRGETKELYNRDTKVKVIRQYSKNSNRVDAGNLENNLEAEFSEPELNSILSSRIEIEQDTKENYSRRSRRPTKTNPIVRQKNSVPSESRKYRQKTKYPEAHQYRGKQSGPGK